MTETKPGFQILSRQNTYHGRAFEVARLGIQTPDGIERQYDLVDHRDSISILPVDEMGQIWFVRQWRLGVQGDLLELPAGVLEPGEEPQAAAEREIREEIGMAARSFHVLGGFYLAPGYCNEYMTVFLARDLYPDPLQMDQDEYITTRKIPVLEAFAMVERGELVDSKTLAALLLARSQII